MHDQHDPHGWMNSPPGYPHMSPHEHLLLTRLLDQGARIERRLIEGDFRFAALTASVEELRGLRDMVHTLMRRIAALEAALRARRLRRRLSCWATLPARSLALMRAVASPREWVMGALIALAAVKGIIVPEDVRAILMWFLRLPTGSG